MILKTKAACELSGYAVPDHFVDVNVKIALPKIAERDVPDAMLSFLLN